MTLNDILMNNLGSAYAESKGLIKKEKVNKFKAFYESNKASKKLDLMVRGESFKSTINEVINYTRGFGEADAIAAPAKKGNVLEGIKNAVITICQKILKFLAEFFNIGYEAKINNMLKACDKLEKALTKVDPNNTIKVYKFYIDNGARDNLINAMRGMREGYNEILSTLGEATFNEGGLMDTDIFAKAAKMIDDVKEALSNNELYVSVPFSDLSIVIKNIREFGKEMLELVEVNKKAKVAVSKALAKANKSDSVDKIVLNKLNASFKGTKMSRILSDLMVKAGIDSIKVLTKELVTGSKDPAKFDKKQDKRQEKTKKKLEMVRKFMTKN